jgi:hypothetical protein
MAGSHSAPKHQALEHPRGVHVRLEETRWARLIKESNELIVESETTYKETRKLVTQAKESLAGDRLRRKRTFSHSRRSDIAIVNEKPCG